MSGRRREGLAPTMFPFLAVLICTLGTLILMLALIANDGNKAKAASDAIAQSEFNAEQMAELAEVDAEIDRRVREASWKREQVVRMRDEQTADLEERRVKQAHLEDHVARLREELRRLEAEIEAAHAGSTESIQSKEAIDKLKSKIEEEKVKIKTLKDEQETKTPRVVIVPHKGPNGTDRRPVYIECRADGVYLHPEGVAIDPKYLDSGIPGPNPLDAALRTIRNHAMKNYGDSVAPYPLIVVRPDGIDTYGAARYAMREWDDQFGYELVPDDVKLAFPDSDPALKTKVEQAIAQAVREQQAIAMQMAGSMGLVGNGRGARGGGPGNSGPGTGGVASTAGTPGSASTSVDGSAATTLDGKPIQRRASDLPVLSARNMEARTADALDNGYRRPGARGPYQASLAEKKAASDAARAIAAGDNMPGDLSAPLGPVQEGSTSQTGAVRIASNDPASLGQPNARTYSGISGDKGIQANAAGANATAAMAQGAGANPSGQAVDANNVARLGDTVDDGKSKADAYAPGSSVTSKSNAPSASADPNAPIGGTQAAGSSDSTNPAGIAPPPMENSSSSSMAGSPSQPPPAGKVNVDVNGQKPPRSLVKRKGSKWALPPEVANSAGTSMIRMIRVECYDDRLVLLPEGGKGATTVYGFSDGNVDRASLELATDVRDRVHRWGAAMPGGRWQPLMEVNVAPGGEMRYQQLRRLMDGSGVDVQAKGVPR
jgi:hypothetical protein